MKLSRGFTLVEALVAAGIFVLLFGAIIMIFMSSSDSWQTSSVQLQLQQELRTAMSRMRSDLSQGGVSTITDVPANGNWYVAITFKQTNGVSGGNISWPSDTTHYALSGTQLERTVGSATTTIGNSISLFQVRRQAVSPSLIEVSLEAQKDTPKNRLVTDNVNFFVQMRN